MKFFESLNHISQALIATCFTWFVTALGASLVFFFKEINRKVFDLMLGFGAGVMIAASFWSLLSPAIEMCEEIGKTAWVTPALGFLVGGLLIIVVAKFLDKAIKDKYSKTYSSHSIKRSILLVSAVTLHNIPEGMAVGVAFGSIASGAGGATLIGSIMLAIGIGLQNFPEGASVSLPLRREGLSRTKSFLYGQASGMVEPIAGVLGVVAAITLRSALPFLLSFAAGAMITVVAAELIPESASGNKNLSTLGVICGFIVMMVMDVALG